MQTNFLTMAILFFFGIAQAQMTDQSRIVQLCVDFSELQPHLPANPDGTMKPVFFMQRDVALSPDIPVTKFGQPVVILSREQIVKQAIEAFFMFYKLDIRQDLATVKFGFVYNNNAEPHYDNITLTLLKKGESWSIQSINHDH
jgi:hypothetical protein